MTSLFIINMDMDKDFNITYTIEEVKEIEKDSKSILKTSILDSQTNSLPYTKEVFLPVYKKIIEDRIITKKDLDIIIRHVYPNTGSEFLQLQIKTRLPITYIILKHFNLLTLVELLGKQNGPEES